MAKETETKSGIVLADKDGKCDDGARKCEVIAIGNPSFAEPGMIVLCEQFAGIPVNVSGDGVEMIVDYADIAAIVAE